MCFKRATRTPIGNDKTASLRKSAGALAIKQRSFSRAWCCIFVARDLSFLWPPAKGATPQPLWTRSTRGLCANRYGGFSHVAFNGIGMVWIGSKWPHDIAIVSLAELELLFIFF
mmetsp:Transcript_66642/g.124403  ORF Transcript_66642/g.124403 Transcript_66642/m.124403 type:complete len:114 (-) Transcript_66642:225-566(-)